MWLFVILGGIFLVLWFLHDKWRYSSYPPGPLRFPLVGNIPQLATLSPHPGKAFYELSKKYGEVFYLRIGLTDILVFNSLKSIHEIRAHKFAAERDIHMVPTLTLRNSGKHGGVVLAAQGKDNNPMKRFATKTLRDFGFGKTSSMEHEIISELDEFIGTMKQFLKEDSSGIITNAETFFDLTTTKIVLKYVLGSETFMSREVTDRKMKELLKLSHDVLESFNVGMSVTIAFPFLYELFPSWLGKNEQTYNYQKLKDYLRDFVNERYGAGKETRKNYRDDPQNFVESFLAKIEEEKGNPDTIFTKEQLNMCLLDFFQTGGETTSVTLSFSILYMIIHENIQEKIQAEIDRNVSPGEHITLSSMKDKLPYTYATMLESFRFASLMPQGLPHVVSEDFYYEGYLIKKGISIMPNFHGVHFCEKTWGDPNNFRPDRFMNDDGTVNNALYSNLIAFGCGPRLCMGITIGENIVFSYFATLLRNFKFMKASASDVLCVEPVVGVAQTPKPFRFKIIPRY